MPPELYAKKRRFWGTAASISGALVFIAPMLGYAGTVVGMLSSFDKLKSGGGANPQALADDISVAMVTTAGGLIVAALSLVLCIISLIRFHTLPKTNHSGHSGARVQFDK